MGSPLRLFPRRRFLAICAAAPALGKLLGSLQISLGSKTAQASFPLTVTRLPEAQLAREVESLLQYVDPQLVHRYVPVAAEKNAWPVWQQALQAYVSQPPGEEFETALDKFYEKPAEVSASALAEIETWVAANAGCRKLVDEGIARGELELPRAAKSVMFFGEVDGAHFRSLALAKSYFARICLQRGEFDTALNEAESLCRLAAIYVRSECMAIDYLVAISIAGIGRYCVYQIAMAPGVSDEVARRAIDVLAEARFTAEDYVRTWRVEFCRYCLPWIAELPENGSAIDLAKMFVLGPMWTGLAVQNGGDYEGEYQEYERAVRQMAYLLDGHPNCWDKRATARLMSEVELEYLREFAVSQSQRLNSVLEPLRSELADWPEEVNLHLTRIMYLRLGLDQIPPPRRLTKRQLKRAKEKVHHIDNVLGKLFIMQHFSPVPPRSHDMNLARIEAARLRIALRPYQRQYKKLPARLEELVGAGLLPEVPTDPYDGDAFKYSPDQRTIWCAMNAVGYSKGDGVIPENVGEEFDEDVELIWQIGTAV